MAETMPRSALGRNRAGLSPLGLDKTQTAAWPSLVALDPSSGSPY